LPLASISAASRAGAMIFALIFTVGLSTIAVETLGSCLLNVRRAG